MPTCLLSTIRGPPLSPCKCNDNERKLYYSALRFLLLFLWLLKKFLVVWWSHHHHRYGTEKEKFCRKQPPTNWKLNPVYPTPLATITNITLPDSFQPLTVHCPFPPVATPAQMLVVCTLSKWKPRHTSSVTVSKSTFWSFDCSTAVVVWRDNHSITIHNFSTVNNNIKALHNEIPPKVNKTHFGAFPPEGAQHVGWSSAICLSSYHSSISFPLTSLKPHPMSCAVKPPSTNSR